MKAKSLLLLLGVLVGAVLVLFLPRLRGVVPEAWRPAPTEGVVEEKRAEADRLLLTLVTEEGAVLSTFSQRVPEIDLLVSEGDTVGLSLDGYKPFVEDPEIVRVDKADRATAEPRATPTRPAVGAVADFTLYQDPPELSPDAEFCPSVSLCTFSEEILVKARCADGQIASVSKSIDHYFHYVDAEACAFCKAFLQNDGVEIRQGPQGYCRFDEYPRLSEVPQIETAVCVRDPDELARYCIDDGTLFLDQWVHRSVVLPCNSYGDVSGFAPGDVACRPVRDASPGDDG